MFATVSALVDENLRVVDAHFHSEGDGDVERALELYTNDIVWESHGDPNLGTHKGKGAVAENYKRIWTCMKNVEFTNLNRFAMEDRVVDESVLVCNIAKDGLVPARVGQRAKFNLLHVFHITAGK